MDGRVAVITGAARGLGRVIAERFQAAGARIVAVDLAEALVDAPADWHRAAIDLSQDRSDAALADLAAQLGTVDIVVPNAGIVPPWRGIDALDRAEWDRVMAINTWGVASTIGAFADALERSGRGAIVVMASINGLAAAPQQTLYTASKHAAIGIMRSAALDLGPRGIRVNALAPGPVPTQAFLDRLDARHAAGGPTPATALKALTDATAMRRLATPADVANAAHFLATDASTGTTGAVLPVEAGLS